MQELENLCLRDAFDSSSSSKFSFSTSKCSSEDSDVLSDSEDKDDSEWKIFTNCRKGGNRACDAAIDLLKLLKLDAEVIDKAIHFYQKTIDSMPLKRIKLKNAIMCACVFVAFSLNKDFREEKSLMEHFGIDKAKYTKGLKLVKTVISDSREVKNSVDNSMFRAMRDLNILRETEKIRNYVEKHEPTFVYDKRRVSLKLVKYTIMYCWLLEHKEQVISIRDFGTVCDVAPRQILRLLFKNSQVLAGTIESRTETVCENFKQNFKLNPALIKILNRKNYINIIRQLY